MASGTIHKYADGTDSGTLEMTNPDVFNGTIYYRKIGNLVYINFNGLQLKADTSGNIDLGAMPSGWAQPSVNVSFAVRIYSGSGSTNYTCSGQIFSTNTRLIRVYNTSSVGTITTNATIQGTAVYMV